MKIRHLIEVSGTPAEMAPLLEALPVDPKQVQETCRRICREEGWTC